MARFLAALLAAAVLAVQAGQLSHAAPSTSELFWRAMLPDTALPDAILRILRSDTNFRNEDEANGAAQPSNPSSYQDHKRSSGPFDYKRYWKDSSKRATATLAGEPAPFGYDYKDSGKRHGATAGEPAPLDYDYKDSGKRHGTTAGKTTPFAAPYNYGYKGSGKLHCATAGEPAPFTAPYNYGYKGSGKRHGAAAGEPSPFGYDYRRSQKRPGGATAKDEPFEYEYHPASKNQAGTGASDAAPTTRGGGAATTTVFFHEDAVRVGERLPFYFPAAAPAALGLLPRRVAESVPFLTPALPGILDLFGVAPDSAMAARMEETLGTCESPALAGEAKFCATSLEALVELATAALGTRDVRAVTSTLPRSGAPLQPYTVRAVRPLEGSSFLACHDEAYPYTVYRCHTTGPARAYMVEMESARGGAVAVATVCHTDTSQWNPEHVSFKLLGTRPGGAPVCHLMPYGHILWVKNVKHSPA